MSEHEHIRSRPTLGDRRRLVEHAQAIADLLRDARDELSALQLAELLRHSADLLEELQEGLAGPVAEAERELRGLRLCLDATLGLEDFLSLYQERSAVPLSRLNPLSQFVQTRLRRAA